MPPNPTHQQKAPPVSPSSPSFSSSQASEEDPIPSLDFDPPSQIRRFAAPNNTSALQTRMLNNGKISMSNSPPLLSKSPRTPIGKKETKKIESAKDHSGQQSVPRPSRASGQKTDGAERTSLSKDTGAAVLASEALASNQPPVEPSSSPHEEAVPAEDQKYLPTECEGADSRG